MQLDILKALNKNKLLSIITKLNGLDDIAYNYINPNERYAGTNFNYNFIFNHQAVLDIVWLEFYGTTEKFGYKEFNPPAALQYNTNPVAWYRTEYNTTKDGSIKGPKNHTGFIPDCINSVILTSRFSAKQKLKLLTRMFNDLLKLRR